LRRRTAFRPPWSTTRNFAVARAFDAALQQTIDGFAPDLVVLAGFMRILTVRLSSSTTPAAC
jgi:folate-dependent phosphoribosylglycinamide formyltransferase PurN